MIRSSLIFLLGAVLAPPTEGHGYILSPRARNFVAFQEGADSSTVGLYRKEYCPHCLNVGGTKGACGLSGSVNYDIPLDGFGQLIPADPQQTYSKGQKIQIEVILTAHHKGHFEFSACPIQTGQAPSLDCFAQYPLEFVSDDLYGATKDTSYPNRAYIAPTSFSGIITDTSATPPGILYRFTMKLPDNVSGDLVLIQWHYLTANSCAYEGYSKYNFPSAWGNMGTLALCGPLPPDGIGVPEQFWNCAEVSILNSPTPPTTPRPVVSGPTQPLPPLPTYTYPPPTPKPVSQPVPQTVSGTCGGGSVGNGICADTGLCCSVWGWCGSTEEHCASVKPLPPLSPEPTSAPLPTPTVTTGTAGTCGNGNVGNGICANNSLCCSQWGYCGTTSEHCNGQVTPTPPAPTPAPGPTPTQPPLQPAPPLTMTFPSYAAGKCSGISNVMSVNVGYYQSWAIWRNADCNRVFASDIDVSGNGYTHLIYSFASINSNFELEPWGGNYGEEVPLYQKFVDIKNSHPGLKTLIAVGGWTFNDPGATQYRFSDVASTAANRAKFASSCVNFCRTYGFDGVDLDWEYPVDMSRGGRSGDKTNYGLLVQAIRAAFDAAPEDLLLSMAVPIAPWRLDEGYDLPAISQGLDFFNLMSYDLHGVWDNPRNLGAHTDMQYIFSSVEYFLNKGIPSNKLVLGLAAYGRSYYLSDPKCAANGCSFTGGGPGGCAGDTGFMPYFTIDEYIKSGKYNSLINNPNTGSAELVIDNNVWISFDTPQTLNLKGTFASQACFRGYMWWAVDMKKNPLVLSIGSAPTTAPGPKPTAAPALVPAPTFPPIQQAPPFPAPTVAPMVTPTYPPVQKAPPAPTPAPNPIILTFPPTKKTPPAMGSPTAPPTKAPTKSPTKAPAPLPTSGLATENWVVSTEPRCGSSELDARGNCRNTCTNNGDCNAALGHVCWVVHENYCGSKPQPQECKATAYWENRCGTSELDARETCGTRCTFSTECSGGDLCFAVNLNYCDCGGSNRRHLRAV